MAYTPEEFDYSFIKQQGIEYIEQGKSLEKQSQKCLYLFQLEWGK